MRPVGAYAYKRNGKRPQHARGDVEREVLADELDDEPCDLELHVDEWDREEPGFRALVDEAVERLRAERQERTA